MVVVLSGTCQSINNNGKKITLIHSFLHAFEIETMETMVEAVAVQGTAVYTYIRAV